MNSLLCISNLDLAINNQLILKDINMTVAKGEIIFLSGPNGSGKSSLALYLAGHPHFHQQAGSTTFKNRPLDKLTAEERSKAGLFLSMQNPLAIEGLSVRQFLRSVINTHRQFHGQKAIETKAFYNLIRPLFANLKLDLNLLVRDLNLNFSGGERKKLEFIQYLLIDPDLVIFDEIDSGLDQTSLKKIIQIIHQKAKKEKSMIMISHNPQLAKVLKVNRHYQIKNQTIVTKS